MSKEIEAGCELDLQIGQQFFGIKRVHFADYDTEKQWPQFIPSGKPWRTHSIDARPLPAFSTDIRAAFQVVEKLWPAVQGRGYGTFRFQLHRRDGDNQWECRFAVDPDGDFSTHAVGHGETAPLAICRAALKAVEVLEQAK